MFFLRFDRRSENTVRQLLRFQRWLSQQGGEEDNDSEGGINFSQDN